MDRQELQRRLDLVAAYRASVQKAKYWAQANDFALKTLSSWCAHSRRWQARLDGIEPTPASPTRSGGFVAARFSPPAASPVGPAMVRIELTVLGTRLEVHWPMTHSRDLAALMREFCQ
jgi:hypothetical protein